MRDVDTRAVGGGDHIVVVDDKVHPHYRVQKINRSNRAKKLYALTTTLQSGKVYKKGSLSDIKDYLFRRVNQPLIAKNRSKSEDSVSA